MKKALLLITGLIPILVLAQDPQLSISDVEVERNVLDTSPHLKTDQALRSTRIGTLRALSTPNPSPEAVALYRFIQDMSGRKILSGQMWVPWGIHEINYVEAATGKRPAIAGFDYINEPSNALENQRAEDWWNAGGISTMMWHWGAPGVGEGYENSKATISIDQCFIIGTPEYEDFWADLERIGDWLQELEDANVPILWRPFHELDGGWFWWSKEGPEKFKLLWTTMYDYLVNERELSNLIWVLCYTGNPDGDWFPGDEYVDIAGADTYDNETDSHLSMFNDVLGSIDDNTYPITFHETGNPPDADACIEDGAMWSWWMIWHTDWLTQVEEEYLAKNYQHDLVLTLDELPDIKTVYGWSDDCEQSEVTASLRVDDRDWQETNKVLVNAGTQLSLRVQTTDDGSWDWSGYGTQNNPDNSQTEQSVALDGTGTITAVFTNTCAAVTTRTFHVVEKIAGVVLSNDLTKSQSPEVFPSLARDLVTIRLPETGVGFRSVYLYDLNGKIALAVESSESEIRLDVSHLSSGLYNVVVVDGGRFEVGKFVRE